MFADAMSYYHLQQVTEIELDITINNVQLSTECKTAMLNTTVDDHELHALAQMIIDGWPEYIDGVPHNLQKYHSCV